MLIELTESVRRYHVGFKQDKSKKFPNGRPQTVTTCKIFLLTPASGATLVGRGVTTLGRKDKDDFMVASKIALTRALDDAKLGKHANTLIWQKYQLRQKRFDTEIPHEACRHRLVAKGHGADWCLRYKRNCDPTNCGEIMPDYGLHSHQRRKMTGRGPGEMIQPRTKAETVFDHKVEKVTPHWLRRVWRWVRPPGDARTIAGSQGRDLYNNLIRRKLCDTCNRQPDFLQGPSGGSCQNIMCPACGQRYWLDPWLRIAKKIEDEPSVGHGDGVCGRVTSLEPEPEFDGGAVLRCD